jgi:hypothetical protein
MVYFVLTHINTSPGRGLIVTSQLGVTNNMDDTTMHGLPYSSEIRQLYLEASLKSQVSVCDHLDFVPRLFCRTVDGLYYVQIANHCNTGQTTFTIRNFAQ